MKRLFRAVPLLLVLASVASFSFLGCGGGGGGDEETPAATEDEGGDPMEGDDSAVAEEDM